MTFGLNNLLSSRRKVTLGTEKALLFEKYTNPRSGPRESTNEASFKLLVTTLETPVDFSHLRQVDNMPTRPGRKTFYVRMGEGNGEVPVQAGRAIAMLPHIHSVGLHNGEFYIAMKEGKWFYKAGMKLSGGLEVFTLFRSWQHITETGEVVGGPWKIHPMQATQIRRQNRKRDDGVDFYPGICKAHIAAKMYLGDKIALVGKLDGWEQLVAEGQVRETLIRNNFDYSSFPPLWS